MHAGFKEFIGRFRKDEEGATAIEYSIIAGLMAAGLAAIFNTTTGSFMTKLTAAFTKIAGFLPQ